VLVPNAFTGGFHPKVADIIVRSRTDKDDRWEYDEYSHFEEYDAFEMVVQVKSVGSKRRLRKTQCWRSCRVPDVAKELWILAKKDEQKSKSQPDQDRDSDRSKIS